MDILPIILWQLQAVVFLCLGIQLAIYLHRVAAECIEPSTTLYVVQVLSWGLTILFCIIPPIIQGVRYLPIGLAILSLACYGFVAIAVTRYCRVWRFRKLLRERRATRRKRQRVESSV